MAPAPQPYETVTGFALTSSGAIGFAQEIENKLALAAASSAKQASSAPGAPQQQMQAQGQKAATPLLGGEVTSNRDAFARMRITCESIVDNKQLGPRGYAERESGDEFGSDGAGAGWTMGTTSMLDDGVHMVETGAPAPYYNRALHVMQNPHANEKLLTAAEKVVRELHIYRIFKKKWSMHEHAAGRSKRKGGNSKHVVPNIFAAYDCGRGSEEERAALKKRLYRLNTLFNSVVQKWPDAHARQEVYKSGFFPFWDKANHWADSPVPREAAIGKELLSMLEKIYEVYDEARLHVLKHGMQCPPGTKSHPEFFNEHMDKTYRQHIENMKLLKKQGKAAHAPEQHGMVQTLAKKVEKLEKKDKKHEETMKAHEHQIQQAKSSAVDAKQIAVEASQKAQQAPSKAKKVAEQTVQQALSSSPSQAQASGKSTAPRPPAAPKGAARVERKPLNNIPSTEQPGQAPFHAGYGDSDDEEHLYCTCANPIPVPARQINVDTGARVRKAGSGKKNAAQPQPAAAAAPPMMALVPAVSAPSATTAAPVMMAAAPAGYTYIPVYPMRA